MQWRGLLCVLNINYIEVNNLKVIFGANHKNLNPAYLEIFWGKQSHCITTSLVSFSISQETEMGNKKPSWLC